MRYASTLVTPLFCHIFLSLHGPILRYIVQASRARALLNGMLAHGPRPDLISFNAFLAAQPQSLRLRSFASHPCFGRFAMASQAVAGQDWTGAISAFEQLRQLDLPPDRHEDVIL